MKKHKLNWNYAHNLSFAPDIWEWLQAKTNFNGIKIPLSRFIAKVLQDEMDNDPAGKTKALKLVPHKLVKSLKKPTKRKLKNYKKLTQNPHKQHQKSWSFNVNQDSPFWLKNIAKQLEEA